MLNYVELDRNWALVKTKPPRFLVGAPLGKSRLRARYHVTVVSVRSQGSTDFTYADAATVLSYDDDILVVGHVGDVEQFSEEV